MKIFTLFAFASLITLSAYAQPSAPAVDEDTGAPPVMLLEGGDIQPVLAELEGKVVVLNMWATWCVPCVKEMPDLLKLREEYREKGVELVLLSMDDPEDLESKVYPFLIEHQIKFTTYLRDGGKDMDFINGIDTDWSGAIPFTVIYDRQGNKRTTITGRHTFEDFEKYVKKAL